MNLEGIQRSFLGLAIVGVSGGWYVITHEWEIPLYINAALWAGIFIVLFWFLIRPVLLPPRGV